MQVAEARGQGSLRVILKFFLHIYKVLGQCLVHDKHYTVYALAIIIID